MEQKNREANREAELHRAEEEEEDEDRDPVEREEMIRRESQQRKAMVDAEKLARKQAAAERDHMCEAIWTMCLVFRDNISRSMSLSRDFASRKQAWERKLEEARAKAKAAASQPRRPRVPEGVLPGGQWVQGKSTGEKSQDKRIECGTAGPTGGFRPPPPSAGKAGALASRGKGLGSGPSGIAMGKSGILSLKGRGGRMPVAGNEKQRPSGGVSFGFKPSKKLRKPRSSPLALPPEMAAAAAMADAEEEKLISQATEAMEVSSQGEARAEGDGPVDAAGKAAGEAVDEVAEAVVGDAAAGSVGEGGTKATGKATVEAEGTDTDGAPSVPALVPPSACVSPDVPSRVKVSVSEPLLTGRGEKTGGMDFAGAILHDPRLFRMYWAGGLVMVKAVIEDASGGEGLPGVGVTHSPDKISIEALGTKVCISGPAERVSRDGFAASCADGSMNSMRALRDNLHNLSVYLDQQERGGDQSLRYVEYLPEKRLVLRQVGEILREEDYQYCPALGGVWMGVWHFPRLAREGQAWPTGSSTPTIEVRVLMQRQNLACSDGVTAKEDEEYAARAAEVAAALESESDSDGEEGGHGDDDCGQGPKGLDSAEDYLEALAEQIHDRQIREVVSGVLDGAVQKIMRNSGNQSDLSDVALWMAKEARRARLAERGSENPATRKFSFESDSDDNG